MNSKLSLKKKVFFSVACLFTLVGFYNATVINSDSVISETGFVKRLDEYTGSVVPGRKVASKVEWKKVSKQEVKLAEVKMPEQEARSETIQKEEVTSAINEDLNLKLVELVNQKKWSKQPVHTEFSGQILANNGVIESLNVSLPGGETVSVSFAELTGNIFEYDLNGEKFSGMMYQVDAFSYVVTMTNGPLEGTRMKFSQDQVEESQVIAEDHSINVGTFGEASSEVALEEGKALKVEEVAAQSFDLTPTSL